jgi:hypothetical protein
MFHGMSPFQLPAPVRRGFVAPAGGFVAAGIDDGGLFVLYCFK